MSLPPQVSADKSGKHRAAAMKEPVQHSGEVYYGMGPPALESSHSNSASSSAVYNPEKGPQGLSHYQQAAPVKWMPQDSIQAPGWSQETPVPAWGQNLTFAPPYMGGVNVRSQMVFHKGVHEDVALPMGGENQMPGPVEVYRDGTQAQPQGRGLEWEQHAAAAMHQAQLQAYQHGHKGVELQGQPHVPPHTLQGSVLQPFQTTFRPSKQQFTSGFYSAFPGNKAVPNLAYGEQAKTQQQLLHQMQQQQQQQQQQLHHHQQQQQQLHQQHHLQLQQQQHQIQPHQIQQHQIQQLHQMQQQYHRQQLQERQQQIQQMQQQQQQQQQMQQQNVPQQETAQPQVQPKQQQTQNLPVYQPPEPCPPETVPKKEGVQSVEPQQVQTCDASSLPDPCPEKVTTNPAETSDAQPAAPRRSRRLSRDGQSPLGPPSTNIWSHASKDPPPSQNGVAGAQKGGESQVTTGGVIQISRRKRRASKEINLETLAQKASEMESLPAKAVKEDGPSGRQAAMVPLVIPVSVPVHRSQGDTQGGWAQGRSERPAGHSDRKPSVIVARRRSLRNPITDSYGQDGENDPGLDEDSKSKLKRRPRPEPLIIPPPKPSTFILPSVYSSITSYQSNLRSPVRLPDNPLTLPPYTPPPILSPVREGSGLYFSTFLTNIAVSNQILPPPATPKSAVRSLLHSTSSEVTPPVLPLITDATPVSLEPRINIGNQYQAEIPEWQDQLSSQFDQHKAELVWLPVDNSHLKHGDQESMEDLMNMACSSVLRGGGTNQELVLHCLHECGGDFLETLGRLMLQDPVFPKGHHLAGYHYSGSDSWTAEEKRYFNKGITAYRKDFFHVQKVVRTKTVAQCVEFYYTYKKQVKIGRSGILTFGPLYSPAEKHTEAVVDVKTSHQSKVTQGEVDGEDKKDVSHDRIHMDSQQARVAQSLQAHDYAGTVLVIKEPDHAHKEAHYPTAPHRPRAEPGAKKSKAPAKPPQDPDAEFPCKKCGRVFYKVKSRSAHMKSHAEQEKKAAALRQKEEEEQAAAEARARKAAAAAAHQGGNGKAVTEQGEVSSQEDSSEGDDDDDDDDWH